MNPDEYAPVSIPLQVGQVWRTYAFGGETITLTDYDSEDKTFRVTNEGRACIRSYKYDGSCNSIWKSDFLKELITPAPAFEEGQVWLRANGAKVHLRQNFSTLKAYFANKEDNDCTGSLAKIEWFKPDETYNLVKLLKQAPVKPPLGLRPRFIVLEERLSEINEAIDRYREAEIAIPSEWLDEKNAILYTLDRLAFNRWWDSEGSAMAPKENENQQEYVRRVSHVAWDNGIFVGRHHETT